MNPEESSTALRNSILEWQKRHGIGDGDPIFASLELWEIYLNSRTPEVSTERIPSFEEFRSSVEEMDRLSREFSKQAGEILQELRAVPKMRTELMAFPYFALIVTGLGFALVGILAGKFIF